MIKERIIQYLDYKGFTKYKFYKKTGFSNGFLDKEGNIGSDKCEKISYEYPDLSLDWLITGEGEMIKSENNYKENIISRDIATSYDTEHSADYWRGKYDQLKEDHERILQELNHIKSASAS